MLAYPYGGSKILQGNYAHNLWIDTINTVGIIPFYLITLYSILTMLNLIKLIKNNNIKDDIKHLLFSIYLGLSINFMLEPILEGVPYLFATMCIINGLTDRYLSYMKRMKL